jgi:hypothetical protein
MRSLVFGIKERTYTEGEREQNAAENIRPEEGWSNGRLEKSAQWEAS